MRQKEICSFVIFVGTWTFPRCASNTCLLLLRIMYSVWSLQFTGRESRMLECNYWLLPCPSFHPSFLFLLFQKLITSLMFTYFLLLANMAILERQEQCCNVEIALPFSMQTLHLILFLHTYSIEEDKKILHWQRKHTLKIIEHVFVRTYISKNIVE